MKPINALIVLVLLSTSLMLSACGAPSVDIEVSEEEGPVKVEHLDGVQPTRVTLTEDAAQRLDIQTVPAQGNVIPYAALLYDTEGNTWVYVNPEPFVFLRSPVTVDHIEGGQAFLSKELPSGSVVVTIGAAELFGSETEFEEE